MDGSLPFDGQEKGGSMKALVKNAREPDAIHYMEIPEPTQGKSDLKIRIAACGICGTDLHLLQDTYPSCPPVVIGHEFSGVVETVGGEVQNFRTGDRVVALTAVETCETCVWCLSGHHMLCDKRRSIGSGRHGGFAEYIVVPEKYAFPIPDQISLEEAALCEPLACVCRALCEQVSIIAGEYVLVAGAGVMGQLAAQVASAQGAVVLMTGLTKDAARFELARKMGVQATIPVDVGDPIKEIQQKTQGRGPKIAIECSGSESSIRFCLQTLMKTGSLIQIAIPGKQVAVDMDLALYKEIRILTSFASEYTSWEIALTLLKHRMVQMRPLISAVLPMSDWEEGFMRAAGKKELKILLKPDATG